MAGGRDQFSDPHSPVQDFDPLTQIHIRQLTVTELAGGEEWLQLIARSQRRFERGLGASKLLFGEVAKEAEAAALDKKSPPKERVLRVGETCDVEDRFHDDY